MTLITNIHTDPRMTTPVGGVQRTYRTMSCMAIPLRSDSEMVGVLTFADPESKSSFNEDDFGLAQTLAKDLIFHLSLPRVDSLRTKEESA